jgi:hypothetical protein
MGKPERRGREQACLRQQTEHEYTDMLVLEKVSTDGLC